MRIDRDIDKAVCFCFEFYMVFRIHVCKYQCAGVFIQLPGFRSVKGELRITRAVMSEFIPHISQYRMRCAECGQPADIIIVFPVLFKV